jgi:hypothetical protein
MERKRRSELVRQNWTKRIQDCYISEKPIRVWCREQGIAYSSFMYWRQRLHSSKPKPTFIELPESISPPGHIEIEFNGVRLKIFHDFDPQTLLKCLQTIRRM